MSAKLLVIIITFGVCLAHSQNSPYSFLNRTKQNVPDMNSGVKTTVVDAKPGEVVSVQTMRDGTTKVHKADLTEMVDIIVEMKDKPLFIQQRENPGSIPQKSTLMSRFMQFRSDLATLHQSSASSLKTTLGAPIIKREFHKIFAGVSIRIPKAMISQITSLSYVKKVHVDSKVKALLDHSVHQIHADSVWTKLGAQGDSVVVGIIDTGIDYSDTALGAGFGPAFKVIGGYDFINDDADPMDDHGHGTHVAGIVAADSDSLKGVAPHARLMAFKVLNSEGWGTFSQVLAGIERAADPNDDGFTNDMVDVVNMSLGGSGTPDDVLSTAVDNAVKLGMTFCIAAGNSWDNFTIGSPGTARLAITVGAVDQNDEIAYFSSKGPNSLIYSIKPEVVAPGVDILSTLPNNDTGRMSGTSMATPHVAGVCALLKSLHRSWTPAQIKSALMTTSLDLEEEVMTQGTGRIDALKAAEVSTFVIPSHLSFGLDENTPTWTITDTLWISNQSLTSQSFTVSFDNLQSGISLVSTPSSFSLAQNDSQQVIVTLTVDNAQVPYPTWTSFTYSGNVYVYGTEDTFHIPWAFVKAEKLIITFDQPYVRFSLCDTANVYRQSEATWIDSTHAELCVPAGTYDMMALFMARPIKCVIKERIEINGTTNLSVSSTEADCLVKLKGVDQNGQLLSSHSKYVQGSFFFAFPDSSSLLGWIILGGIDSMSLAPFSDRFSLLCGQSLLEPNGNLYCINHDALLGLHESHYLINRVSEFRTQNLTGTFPPSPQYKEIDAIFWTKNIFANSWHYSGISGGNEITGFAGDWNGRLFINCEQHPLHSFSVSLTARDCPRSLPYRMEWFYSAPFAVINDSIASYFGTFPSRSLYLSPNSGTMTFGKGLNYTDAHHINNFYGTSNITGRPEFYGQMDERKTSSIFRSHYTIYDNIDNIVASDSLIEISPMDVPAGEYRFVVKHQDYFVRNAQGYATLTTRFDLRKTDANPPQLSSLRLLNSAGQMTDTLTVGEHGAIIFSSADFDYVKNEYTSYVPVYKKICSDSTKFYYKRNGTAEWISTPVAIWMEDTVDILARGLFFTVDISDATQFDSSGIDIKLIVQDMSGNSTEWSLVPAFSVGEFNPTLVNEEKENESLAIPRKFTLRQNYPNPFNPITTIDFDIPRASFVTLEVFNLLGQKVANVLAKDLKAGTHKISWNASSVSSGIYFYRLSAGTFINTKKLLLLK